MPQDISKFATELTALINKYSLENNSNTPDFILANYLVNCLNAFNLASIGREKWYQESGKNDHS